MHTTYLAILTQLNNAGARYRQFRHEPLISAWELDETLPFALDNLLKTVAFRIKDEGLVLAGVQGFARIDYRALADVFGINRRQLRALGPEEVVAELAMEVGGVCPLPQSEGVAVVIDAAMAGRSGRSAVVSRPIRGEKGRQTTTSAALNARWKLTKSAEKYCVS